MTVKEINFRDESMDKAKTAYTSHTPILLLKGDINHSLSVKNPNWS